ncbi:D-alanine--D-alanine ligase [Pleionea sp. CnH1-48]|uniref:D-alanine--D-alanine ligase n=1 Tax=Pleionea sp. CnH1-48 TaxID=2954494 RepID=UPI0020971A28|nr:D-alanine--D-alanine ligase [Pleionea sp. CnH1-48]MCO7223990.1 D-alanine--D-alanine ligase [Pleionea sp. CnH1-48]
MSELNISQIGKTAVLLGGHSAEREVSLRSGEAVFNALRKKGVDCIKFDPSEQELTQLKALNVKNVWIALHGRGGEDGTIQAALEFLNIKYTGSSVSASAIAMDKWRSKMIWKAMGLPVANHTLVDQSVVVDDALVRRLVARLGPVVFVKPSREGSSVGMNKATSLDSLKAALIEAKKYDDEVLVESFITGKEYTVSILGNKALPSISMVTPREFYDYEAKYHSNETQYFCPSGLNPEEEKEIAELAQTAFSALGCQGWGRVDFIRDEASGQFMLLEANTVPGMTESSLVPKAAAEAGVSFGDLVLKILETAVNR